MIEIKTLIKILFLINNISYVLSECKMTVEEADKCGHDGAFFGNRDVFVPSTDADLDKHCSDTRKSLNCIRTFVSTCLDGFVKQTTELALNNGAKHLERRCDNPKDRQDFLTHVKCLSSKEKMEPFHICADKNLVMMEQVMTSNEDDIVGAGCCIFHTFQNCIRQSNKEICGEETTDYWDEVINEIAEDSISISCGGYETIEKCEKSLNPKVWNDIKSIDAINDAKTLAEKHKHQSGIALMIDFMKKLSKN